MLTPDEARARAEELVHSAVKAGASAADAVYRCDASTQVQVRLGALEDVARSEGEDISLRVFVGQHSASVSSSSMNRDVLAKLAERAVAMAREAPEDPYAGLAPADMLLTGALPDVQADDGGDPDPAFLKERALAAEAAARAVKGVTNSEGAGASAGRSVGALATSTGFSAAVSSSHYALSASVLAGEQGAMERDHDYRVARHLADLDSAEAIGLRAGERAVARLNPVPVKSGAMPIVFDPRVGGSLIGHFLGAISGPAIARRTSFLLDALDTLVFDPSITIIDDPLRPRAQRSRSFDGEGLPTAPTRLIDAGRLTGWMLDSASARQLGLKPTGHAASGGGISYSNVHVEPGAMTLAQLMADIGTGIYVTELIGQGVNGVTGDYSRGAGGFLIENGRLGPPVSEITVAGQLKDMFAAMRAANDIEWFRAINVPTLRVDGMTVAGG